MIYSMTGYGETKVAIENINVIIELYSLNSRTLDIQIYLPPAYQNKMIPVKKLLQKNLYRGKIDLFVKFEYPDENNSLHIINKEKLNQYNKKIQNIKTELNIDLPDDNLLSLLFTLPGVVEEAKPLEGEDSWQKIEAGILQVIKELTQYRKQEGESIYTFIWANIEKITKFISQIEKLEEKRNKMLSSRLQNKFSNPDIIYDKDRFEQELIYYLEKLNIAEEKQRLQNHCNFLKEVCANDEILKGKKLGFILQEITREINTLGSKAQHAEIQRVIVEMKNYNEEIKEQLFNIL